MICSPKNGSDNNMVNFVVTRVSKTHFYSNTVLLLYSQHSKQHRWSSYACFSRMEHQRRERAGRHESRPAQSVTHQSHSARLGRFSHRNATAEISCIISWLIRRDFVAEQTLTMPTPWFGRPQCSAPPQMREFLEVSEPCRT